DTLTIGVTVMAVSLLAGLLVEVVSRRSGPRTRSAAGISVPPPLVPVSPPLPTAPPESVAPVPAPQRSGSASRRAALRIVIAGVAGIVCAALVVLVIVVVTNLSDPARTSTPTRTSASAAPDWTKDGPDIQELKLAMPAALREATLCQSLGANTGRGTCKVGADSPLISGLVAVSSLGQYLDVEIVPDPWSHIYQTSRSSVIRNDGSIYAVFTPEDRN